jgi:hypothetical protein
MGKHRENTEEVHIWKRNKYKTARGEEETGPCGSNSLPAYKTLYTINEDLKPAEVDDWN